MLLGVKMLSNNYVISELTTNLHSTGSAFLFPCLYSAVQLLNDFWANVEQKLFEPSFEVVLYR